MNCSHLQGNEHSKTWIIFPVSIIWDSKSHDSFGTCSYIDIHSVVLFESICLYKEIHKDLLFIFIQCRRADDWRNKFFVCWIASDFKVSVCLFETMSLNYSLYPCLSLSVALTLSFSFSVSFNIYIYIYIYIYAYWFSSLKNTFI